MSFADRLQKRTPLDIAATQPRQSALVKLCLPKMLEVEGEAVGLVNLELAPILVGGMSSLRILDAIGELLAELEQHYAVSAEPHEQLGAFGPELREVGALVRQHLDSIAAAADQAHAEHEASHHHGSEPLQ